MTDRAAADRSRVTAMRHGLTRRGVIVLALAGVPGIARAAEADAKRPIEDLHAALRASMKLGKKAPFPRHFDAIAPTVDRVFDLETIMRTSVGLRWSSLSEAAHQTLLSVFRTFTVARYASNFDEEGGESFEVVPALRSSGADVIVGTRIVRAKEEPVPIDYVMRSGPAGWRIVDVLLDGSISQVAVNRSDFRSLLGAGDAAPLIASLKQKVGELSDGAIRP